MPAVRHRKEDETDENPVNAVMEGRVSKAAAQPAKRRALGDIGNTVQTVTTRNQGKGKAEVGKAADAVKPAGGGVKTRSQRLAEKNAATKTTTALVTAPRTRSQVAAAAAAAADARKQGVSMSALLQQRSEQATAPAKTNTTNRMKEEEEECAPPSPLPDIDQIDAHNPQAEAKYANDIHEYYRRVEPLFKVNPNYMSGQRDINDKMRAILIDWLVEVHLKFKLMPETLFLTVNLIDRYLEKNEVGRKDLQLVGVTAMLIASKYEEIWAPEVRDFVYISDKAYTREQILAQEKDMLKCLQFNLTLPTAYNFLARFLKAAGCLMDKQVNFLTSYLVELTLPEYTMLHHDHSLISAAAVYVALRVFNRNDPYPKALARHSMYTLEQIKPCASVLLDLLQKAPTASLNAVHKKYSNQKFQEIAKDSVIQEFLVAEGRMVQ